MILHVLRALFVLLMAAVGYFYLKVSWLTMAMGMSLAVIFICVDILSPRKKLAIFAGTFFGLIVGIALAYALSFAVVMVVDQAVSLSPKLAHSVPRNPIWGPRHDARRRRPEIVRALMRWPWQLKLVVRAYDPTALAEDLAEVEAMIAELGLADPERERVLLMPECIDPIRLASDYAALVPACRAHGVRLGPRLHIAIFGHTPGT